MSRVLLSLTVLVALVACGSRPIPAADIDTSLYATQMRRAVNQAHTCQEALQNVRDVRDVWLPSWPAAPLPALTCPDDGGTHVDASPDRD